MGVIPDWCIWVNVVCRNYRRYRWNYVLMSQWGGQSGHSNLQTPCLWLWLQSVPGAAAVMMSVMIQGSTLLCWGQLKRGRKNATCWSIMPEGYSLTCKVALAVTCQSYDSVKIYLSGTSQSPRVGCVSAVSFSMSYAWQWWWHESISAAAWNFYCRIHKCHGCTCPVISKSWVYTLIYPVPSAKVGIAI